MSATLRSAWDGRPLQLLTRTAPARASDAHVTVIGHITACELRHHLTGLELANGLANRFLLICCRRTRLLPEGGASDPLAGTGLTSVLGGAIEHARTAGRLRLDEHARELWYHAYAQLAYASRTGIAGALCARAEAHVIRLALIYALADGERQIKPEHLQAALALWDYAARSASWALQSATGDPLAEQIHAALANHPGGLTRSQINDTLQHNRPAEQIQRALDALTLAGRATRAQIPTAGRPPSSGPLHRRPASDRPATATREWVASARPLALALPTRPAHPRPRLTASGSKRKRSGLNARRTTTRSRTHPLHCAVPSRQLLSLLRSPPLMPDHRDHNIPKRSAAQQEGEIGAKHDSFPESDATRSAD